jgi:hypothetical protein
MPFPEIVKFTAREHIQRNLISDCLSRAVMCKGGRRVTCGKQQLKRWELSDAPVEY